MRTVPGVILTCGIILGVKAGSAGVVYAAEAIDAATPRIVRVRAPNADIGAVIRDASEQSTTFHRLLDTIDVTDGLVFVEDGKCGHSVRACLSLSVKVTGPYRLLRVTVDTHTVDCELMASIGHELQHAIEVLSDPHVRDMPSAYSLFERLGPTGSGRFETLSALQVGDLVRGEVCRVRR